MIFIDSEIVSMVHSLAYLTAIITFTIFGILFLFKLKNKPPKIRNYLIGIVLFLFLYAISRSAELINDFIEDPGALLWYLGAIFGAISLLPLLFVLEFYIIEKKTKFIFTILSFVLFILAMILDPRASNSIGKNLLYISSFPALTVPFMYFYVAYKTSGDTRKRSIGAGVGFLIAFFGIIVDTALGNLVFKALVGVEYGNLVTAIIYMISIPTGLIVYYRSIRY